MAFFESNLGIDFRQNHIVLTVLRKTFGKIHLVDYQVHTLLPETQKEEREAQLIGLVNTFIAKHLISKDQISVSVPREKVIARFLTLPAATKENLRKVLEYEIPKYTPFDRGEIYFDYHILKEDKDWLHLFVAFIQKGELDRYLQLLKKMGIRPVSIQIPSTAALNLFFHNAEPKEGETSVLLDITEPFLEVNLIQGGEWKESLHLPLPAEERESRILNTFHRLGIGGDSSPKPTLIVYGLDAAEKMFPSLRETDQIKGIIPPPLNRIETGKGLVKPDRVFPSVGIPLRGLTKTRIDLNLLPVEMRKKVRQVGKPLLIILASLAVLLSLSWGLGIFYRYRDALDEANAEMKKRKPEVEAVEKLQRKKETLGKEITEINKTKAGEFSKILILEELTRLLPGNVWIWNFKYTGKEIEISGYADSASDLLPLLDKSELFEKVEFAAPVTKERERRMVPPGPRGIPGAPGASETPAVEKEKERFKIKMRLEGRRSGA
jgi:general secretion pathway protein L